MSAPNLASAPPPNLVISKLASAPPSIWFLGRLCGLAPEGTQAAAWGPLMNTPVWGGSLGWYPREPAAAGTSVFKPVYGSMWAGTRGSPLKRGPLFKPVFVILLLIITTPRAGLTKKQNARRTPALARDCTTVRVAPRGTHRTRSLSGEGVLSRPPTSVLPLRARVHEAVRLDGPRACGTPFARQYAVIYSLLMNNNHAGLKP
jgi:hypothetical protein